MQESNRRKWDVRFIELAKHVSTWSKDPSTQTGAVIVDDRRVVIGMGYNGFARGVYDDPERYANRELKYKLIVHCERNAILFANGQCRGCTLYTYPFLSCSVCAAMVIQAGITRCVAPIIPEHLKLRWYDELALSQRIFGEAGVQVCLL
jgi:dCMP deaminase